MGWCCECRAPRRLRYVPPVVVFSIIAWLYGSFIFHIQPVLSHHFHVSIIEIAPLHIMTALLTSALVQCLLSNESFVEKREKGQEAALEDEDATVVETKSNGARRFCRRCRVWKSDRMHHCSTCRRCVLKMDHHCVYINKCIGYYNYKFFLQFLGWGATTSLYEASLIFRFMLLDYLDHALGLFFYGKLKFFSPSLQVVLVFFVSACLGAAMMCFFFLHVYFTMRNQTTLEFCEKRREPEYVNYFDVGVLTNVQHVLGTYSEFIYWFVPLPSPSVLRRGATTFPVNTKLIKTE